MRKLVIDTDCGLDDANAILMALSDSETQVLAITTVDGNTSLDNVVCNVLRVLRVADRLDIPVYKGASCSLLNLGNSKACHHGEDGLGDYEHHEPVDMQLVQSEHAVMAISRIAREHPGVDLVCLGPLTNVALAMRIDPEFGSRLGRICIMGGNYKCIGNATMTSEFNFYRDPESAHIVLADLIGPCITLVGWEVCQENTMPCERARQLMLADTKKAAFTRGNLAKTFSDPNSPGVTLCDEVAMSCYLCQGVIIDSVAARFRVELSGNWSRGLAIPDWQGVATDFHQPLVSIVTKFDIEKVCECVRRSLSN